MTETLDPLADGSPSHRTATQRALVVLHHVDLSMVGLVHVLEGPVTIGRDEPFFRSPHGASPLADPCISRQQVRVAPHGHDAFEVTPLATARRPTHARTLRGDDVRLPAIVPAGTLLAIGDRAAIALVHRPLPRLASSLGMVGESAAIVALRHRIDEVAGGDETALLTGETGSGKELVARALHDASPFRSGPFVAVNGAALPENLVESELFGHVRGAFSGARGSRGLFGAAENGTLFLDEVGELPPTVQAKLLRVIETKRVRPVGATDERPVRVRLLAATHQPLEALCERGAFRFDLFARLAGVRVHVPRLADRVEDVPLLFSHFLRERLAIDAPSFPTSRALLTALTRAPQQDPGALPLAHALSLLGHPWAGNVRELARFATDLAVSARSSGRLPPVFALPSLGPTPAERPRPSATELADLLDRHGHVQSRAAAALGVPAATFDRWMRELKIARPRDLTAADIAEADRLHDGDLVAMASHLRVSPRGLRQRQRELARENDE